MCLSLGGLSSLVYHSEPSPSVRFTLSNLLCLVFLDYQAHNVDEDIPIGTSILKVKAADADSGQNAEIEYYLSDDHFTVSSNGIISNNRRLDADSNNAYYEFVVTAKDKGNSWTSVLKL